MLLTDAIVLYKKEEGVTSNSYEWYRKDALRRGSVSIGEINILAYKKDNVWHVSDTEFKDAIEKHRKTIEIIKKHTQDHSKGIIHDKDGESVKTNWGHYTIFGDFRLEINDYDIFHHRSSGIWKCNNCNLPAEEEHNKSECHLCSDWNGCGKDCKLSKVFCKKCGKSKSL